MFPKEVLKTMTEGEILFNLPWLIFIRDSIVLNVDLSLFPLCPYCSYTAATLFVSATVFFNHDKFSVNIPLKDVIKFYKIGEMLVFKDLYFLS